MSLVNPAWPRCWEKAVHSRWSWDMGKSAGLLPRGGGTLVECRRVNGSWPFW